jgi:SAM-dependent methyltransferase
LIGRKALEIGGPTEIFGDAGCLPIYSFLRSLDNCIFSTETVWTGKVGGEFRYHSGKEPGRQMVCEATDLPIADRAYEAVIASHCLEHVANPIRALKEWSRILMPHGRLLVFLPDKHRTFDRKRPVTPLEHMIHDFERNVGEDDLTHVSEVLALHDDKNREPESPEAFEQHLRRNPQHRMMHHHVFDESSGAALISYVGFVLRRVETFEPFHIAILASKS